MYYLTERSVMANESNTVFAEIAGQLNNPSTEIICAENGHEVVFSQVDLWNLQKQMKTIHVTDRFPRTWEGIW
jgi:hypothetical protein